jgi:ABC-type molybdate transport system substrate-binding protein
MSKGLKTALTLLLLAAFGAALFFALRGQKAEVAQKAEEAEVAAAGSITGLISLDVEPYFADARVQKILAGGQIYGLRRCQDRT